MTEGPQAPSAVGKGGAFMKPEEWNPEMAAASMAKDLINRMGTPTILAQKFVVWHGIIKALNHIEPTYDKNRIMTNPGNSTGIDTSLRLAIYDHAAKNSVNVNGQYFFEVWKYLNKPKIIVTQPGQIPGQSMEEEQPSLGRRILNRITGGGGNNVQPNTTQ
jgi:hypothetical protein